MLILPMELPYELQADGVPIVSVSMAYAARLPFRTRTNMSWLRSLVTRAFRAYMVA